jgi:error-prone DNA polymerase
MLRPGLDPKILRSSDLAKTRDGTIVQVAGMVVARQRPETAKGIVFMLLEDERGNVNLIVPPPVYDRHRPLVRAAPLLRAKGKLERREGTINVVVTHVAALERTEKPQGRSELPSLGGNNTSLTRSPPAVGGRDPSPRRRTRQLREHAVAELRAVAPSGHSFGRRG